MKIRRWIALGLCLLMALSLAACGGSETRAARSEAIRVLTGEDAEEYALSTGTTLEKQTLYDRGDIEIVLAGITGTPDEFELVLAVRNGSRHDIDLAVDRVTLDGWTVSAWTDLYNVKSHSVAMGSIRCGYSYDGWYMPEDVGEIELEMTITDADTYSDIASGLHWELTTSAGPQMMAEPDGIELLNDGGLVLWLADCSTGAYLTNLTMLLANGTGRDVEITSTWVEVDGVRVDGWLWETLADGEHSSAEITLFDTDGEPVLLTAESEITMELEVLDSESYRTLARPTLRFVPGELEGFVPYAAEAGEEYL